MATSPVAKAPSSRERAIEAIESRIKLLAVLADALAHDPLHQEKVRHARDHILELRQELARLQVRRGPAPKTPRAAAFARPAQRLEPRQSRPAGSVPPDGPRQGAEHG